MSTNSVVLPPPPPPTFQELFTPKLVTVLREGYGADRLKADAVAGLTVAIVALPLSMAIAIASGATPAQGLYTAIVGGFFVSLLSGSRFQIGGPAGAFIVLVAATIAQHGMDGLILATVLSGFLLMAMGFLQLGTYIKFIPYPVTVGFTAGIAVIIFASQIKDLFGLTLPGPEPGPLLEKLPVLWHALPTATLPAMALAFGTIAVIVTLRRFRPHWPGMLIAVSGAALLTALLGLDVATIGSRFGGIPQSLPMPALPDFSAAKVVEMLPAALSFALLGSIESLLSATVADGMTGRRHRSNCELVGQGVANVASGLFGGFCVTGTIARTATNVRAGAASPVSGMLHALFLLAFVLIAAPLAAYTPLASLAGVLAVVSWTMVEKQAFARLITASRGDAAVLLVTFLLTIFRDLTEAIVVGFALGSVLFIHRMSQTTQIEGHAPFVSEDVADDTAQSQAPFDDAATPGVVVYRITGAFFFGAASSIGSVLDRIADTSRVLVIDLSAVPFMDSTAANTIEGLAHKAHRRGMRLILAGTTKAMREELFLHGLKPPLVTYKRNVETALREISSGIDRPDTEPLPLLYPVGYNASL
jgi:SulP family sulfate permease